MKPIPTIYQGVQMRSRLEAKWAAFFDLMGWKWSYEPADLDGWIPDFVLHVDWAWRAEPDDDEYDFHRVEHVYVEVKPVWKQCELAAQSAFQDMRRNRIHHGLLLGNEPQGQIIGWFADGDKLVAGYIGDRANRDCPRLETFDLAKGDSDWGDALCHSWWCDPVNDESRHVDEPPASEQLAALWVQAKNEVQWRKPRRRSRP